MLQIQKKQNRLSILLKSRTCNLFSFTWNGKRDRKIYSINLPTNLKLQKKIFWKDFIIIQFFF